MLEEAYINKGIKVKDAIQEERGAHQESREGEREWHEFNTLCSNYYILGTKIKLDNMSLKI